MKLRRTSKITHCRLCGRRLYNTSPGQVYCCSEDHPQVETECNQITMALRSPERRNRFNRSMLAKAFPDMRNRFVRAHELGSIRDPLKLERAIENRLEIIYGY